VRRLASTVRAQQDFFAAFVTAEMGKPLAESAGEMTKSAVTADYHADRAR
jgi:succinate-semialdehyde dehydrogenase/glutarate-semialdehyde dehydrogenase